MKNWTAQSQRWEELSSQESDCSTPPSLLQRSSATPCKGWLHTPQRCPRSSTVDRMPTVRKIDTWLLIDTYGSFRGHSQWIQLGFPMREPEAVLNNFNGYEEAKKKGTSILLRKGLLVTDLHMVSNDDKWEKKTNTICALNIYNSVHSTTERCWKESITVLNYGDFAASFHLCNHCWKVSPPLLTSGRTCWAGLSHLQHTKQGS